MKNQNLQNIPEHNQLLNQYQPPILFTPQKQPFGNMPVLFTCFDNVVTIGPNYIFFSIAWSLFTLAAYGIITAVFNNSSNFIFQSITLIICILQPLSYLIVALSNPGVIHKSVTNVQADLLKICKKCNINIKRPTYHCSQCDVCVDQYDHHCPWVSKCIGKNNLCRFYFFLTMTPIFLFYSIISIAICTIPTQNSLIQN